MGDEAGHQAGPCGHRLDDQALGVGVRPTADRAQAVERRHPEGGGEVAVATATDGVAGDPGSPARRSASVWPTPTRHWWTADPAGDRDPGVRIGRPQAAIADSTRSLVGGIHVADAPPGSAPLAGMMLPAVPADATVGVTVVPTSGVLELADDEHLPRDASISVFTPFSGSRPACAGAPVDRHLERPGALPAGLEQPAVGRLFEHSARSTDRCPFLDERA